MWKKIGVGFGIFIVIAAIIGACSENNKGESITPTVVLQASPTPIPTNTPKPTAIPKPTEKPRDILAEAACEHFYNIIQDIKKGILNDAEIRQKMKEVYEKGVYADSPAIRSSSERLLSSATQGDVDAFTDAMIEMTAACSNLR